MEEESFIAKINKVADFLVVDENGKTFAERLADVEGREEFTSDEQLKLSTLENREKHTGTQSLDTITETATLKILTSEERLKLSLLILENLEYLTNKNQVNGYAGLDTNGKIHSYLIPSLATLQVFEASSEANMLLLTSVGIGDQCVRSDLTSNNVFILKQTPASDLNNWIQLSVTAQISSINGKTGIVVLDKSDIGLGNVDNTSDISKPISTLQQLALNTKINISDTVDNLTSTETNKPLSANQGNVLKGFIDNINTLLSSDDTTLDELQEIVEFIKINKTTLDSLGITNIAGLETALNNKQDVLISGTNIKTVNGNNIIGAGNIDINATTPIPVSTQLTGTYSIVGTDLVLDDGKFSISTTSDGLGNKVFTNSGTIVPTDGFINGLDYIKQFEDGSTVATSVAPAYGSVSAVGDWYRDCLWHEPTGYVDGSLNTSTADLIPKLISNTSNGLAFASNEPNASYPAWKAFDDSADTSSSVWINDSVVPCYIGYVNQNKVAVNKFGLLCPDSNYITEFKFQGSNDTTTGIDGTWVDVSSTFTAQVPNTKTYYTSNNQDSYKAYRVYITAFTGSVQVAELEFIEAQVDIENIVPYNTQFAYASQDGKLLGIEVVGGEPVAIHLSDTESDIDAPKIVEDVIQVDKCIQTGNRKIIELGTIFNNNRYVVTNPFGNENYEDCDVKCQIFYNSKWSRVIEPYKDDNTGQSFGVMSESMNEGIVIVTGYAGVRRYSESDTSNSSDSLIVSAPARVIVTYQGNAQ